MKLISVLVFMVMAVAILVDAVPMKHLGSSAAGQDDPAPSQPPSFDKSAFRKGSWLMRDHSRSSVTELEKELAFAMVEKKPTKVIKMLVDMRAECNIDSNLSPKEESLAIDACRWKAQIIQASTWLGRKLQKELNEAEPDAEDLAEKLAWLNEHDALALLSAANPTLVSEAQAELDRLSSLAVTEATSTTNRKRGRAEVIFVLALPGAGKTTVSKKATEATGCSAISIGELARQACETGGPLCKKIRNMRMVGAAEDPSLSVGLLKEELKYRVKHQDEACFIVDGFPRSLAHLAEWADEKMNERFVVSGLIVLDIDAATAEKRVLGRHDSARGLDDTPTVFAERVKYYAEQTVPVIDTFHRAAPQKVRVVSAQGKPAAVAADFTEAVKALTGKRRMQRVDL